MPRRKHPAFLKLLKKIAKNICNETPYLFMTDFTCCGRCGYSQIDDLTRDEDDGYMFFHAQDTDSIKEGNNSVYLKFGAFTNEPNLKSDIFQNMANVLQEYCLAENLNFTWNGDSKTCFLIEKQ